MPRGRFARRAAFFPAGVVALVGIASSAGAPARAAVHPVIADRGMVVASEPHAVDAGTAILQAGGNAFDAAVAVGFALAVTHPMAGNLGGGGFCVATTAEGDALALDFRETAPAAAHRDLFLDDAGEPIPGASTRSHLAVGTPGSVDGLLRLLERHGTLPRRAVIAPAIALARDGFPVTPFLHGSLENARELLQPHAGSAALFFPNGEALAPGSFLRQPDLARTLERIAAEGRDGFYAGETAQLFAAEMARGGGIVSGDDLAGYAAVWREPFTFRDGEYELVTHPLPSSGGIVIAQVLGMVDREALRAAGFGSAEYVRKLVEAERLAFADRNHYLGDPDFADVPLTGLVDPAYLARRRSMMPKEGAGHSDVVGRGWPDGAERSAERDDRARERGRSGVHEPGETTHYCVVDEVGNAVAITTTLNGWYGMGAVVPGAGFLLNNEMDDFSSKPGVPNLYGLVGAEANAIAPGKRMLSSMTPTIVRRDGEFLFTMGSPGGSTIITTVLQIYLNLTLFDMNVREAVDAGRFHHQWLPDVVRTEPFALSPDTRARLETMGYEVVEYGHIGRATAIVRREDGCLAGWADRRGIGKAAGQ